jgi:transcriptional regulator with XRE-family HTH domain
MNSLGSRVKQLRKEKGLTQAELGNLSGIHHTNIGRIENKEMIPQADVLFNIAESLGTTVEWLLTGNTAHTLENDTAGFNQKYQPPNLTDETLAEICQLCHQLTVYERKEVLQFIKFLLYQKDTD